MSVKERLEAKRRRRVVVPVLVDDPSEDLVVLQGATVALNAAAEHPEQAESLRQQVEQASAAVQSHWVDVELEALPKNDWNLIADTYQTDEGGIDWPQALPLLLAESCVDPELKDADWWRDRLTQPEWSQGDFAALQLAVYQLNVEAAGARALKG